MNRSLLCWLLVSVVIPATASGQGPAERRELVRFRDSLANVHVPVLLLAEEERLIQIARQDRDDPMHHLRLGLVALRLAELVPGPRHVEHALQEFEWAAELRPAWPWPWYGLGLATAGRRNIAGGFAGGLFTMLGLDRERLAGESFGRAVAADPAFVPALLEYASVALEQRIEPPGEPALAAVRRATADPLGWDPELLLARGRLERRFGDADSARIAFRRAAAFARSPGRAWLELARTPEPAAFADGAAGDSARSRARLLYRTAVLTGDPVTIASLRRDIEPLARMDELEAFDRASLDSRDELVRWLEQFWDWRDAWDIRDPGSRLVEHYRRWQVAEREFRLPPFRRRYRWGIEIYQSGDPDFDDRGVVYIRHGEPALRIIWPRSGALNRMNMLDRNYGNETWRYDRSDGQFALHFVARDDPDDYRMVDSPSELDVAGEILASRAHEIPGMQRMMRAGPKSLPAVHQEVREENRMAMAIATRTDSWARVYSDVLAGAVQWLPVGARNGVPLVHLVYGLDGDGLRRLAGEGTESVPLRIRASAISRTGTVVARLDTVQVVPVPREEGMVVASRAEMTIPSGRVTVRFAIEADEETGTVFRPDSLAVPFREGRSLDISAVLLGSRNHSLPWRRGAADTAWVDLAPRYRSGDTVSVYAEIYGVEPGNAVPVELSLTRRRSGLARLLGGGSTVIGLKEELAPVEGRVIRYDRELSLDGLEPGDYVLELRAGSGERVQVRRRGVVVREREP